MEMTLPREEDAQMPLVSAVIVNFDGLARAPTRDVGEVMWPVGWGLLSPKYTLRTMAYQPHCPQSKL